MDITVKNVVKAGSMSCGVITGILCGLTLFIVPAIAVDHYQMTVVIKEEGKEPITREYNGSITTYSQIFFIMWGVFIYPLKIDHMLDHLMNDLAEDNKKTVVRHNILILRVKPGAFARYEAVGSHAGYSVFEAPPS